MTERSATNCGGVASYLGCLELAEECAMNDDQKATLTLFSRRVAVGAATEREIEFMEWYARQDVDVADKDVAKMVCEQAGCWVG